MKKIVLILLIVAVLLALGGCREADYVSENISKEADNFNVCREIIVVNVRDNTVLYTLRGYFSLKNEGHNELCVISEVGDGVYKKDFIYLSEWTTYVCTDLTGAKVDRFHYELNILPQMVGGVTFTSND
ncbi:MAG: hypothetical protein J6Y20_01255 [Lachnospiraceae bacterium]|nr:hypothetical protein [Lachnospiraceae bacterium]